MRSATVWTRPLVHLVVVSLSVASFTALLVQGCGGKADDSTSAARQAALERIAEETREAAGRRADEPDAAEAYYRARRQSAPGIEPMRAYEQGRQQMARMPRHALRLGRHLEREGAADLEGATSAANLATWEELGPGNIGGRTRVLLVDPRDPQVFYAAGVSGGVWKTTNGGAEWVTLSDSLANITVNSLVMDPDDPQVLYAGTGEGYFREIVRGTGLPLRGAGIFKTSDGGATWTFLEATRGEDFHWVNDIVISVNDSRRVYAATRTGVWRSSDAGETWQRVLEERATGGCLDLAVRTDRTTDTLFASCGTFERATVYRCQAAEGEAPWSSVFSEPNMGRTSLAIAPSHQDVIYALAAFNDPQGRIQYDQGLLGVYRSTSGGGAGSWQPRVTYTSSNKLNTLLLTNPIAACYVQCGLALADSYVTMGWYVNVIAVDPRDENRVWAAGVDIFRSDDGGANWGAASYWWTDSRQSSFMHADQHGITFHPAYDGTLNQTMFVVGDGGVYRTDSARSRVGSGAASLCDPGASRVRWYPLNHRFGVTQFYHGAPFPDGQRYLGGTQDNGTILGDDARGGDGWQHILGGDGGYVAVDPRNPDVVFAETQWFSFYVSYDGGRSFERSVSGVTEPSSNFLFITPFSLDPNNSDRLWAGGRRMWRTENQAIQWNAASTTLADGGSVSALAVAPGDSGRVVAGTSRGTVYRSTSALTAGSSTVWEGARPRDGFLTSLSFDPAGSNTVWATYGGFGGNHVWRSGDGGITWAARDGSSSAALPDVPAHCILIDPSNSQRLFLATDLGVFISTDAGASWAVENTGFASVVTESLAVMTDPSGTTWLFAFTHGRGAWRVEVAEDDGVDQRPLRRRIPSAG